jgi:hypothetical protein
VGLKLTPKEKQVLYGLVRWPDCNDNELAGELDLGRTTVTVIRQRLEKKQLVSKVLIPDFQRIGCELLTTLYGEFTGTASNTIEAFRESIQDGVSAMFYMIRAGGMHLSFGAARSLTEVREHISEHHRLHHESGYLTDRRHNYVFFPLKFTHIPRFFDYAPLLAEHFDLPHSQQKKEKVRRDGWRPTKRERKTFHALIAHPHATDEDVAAKAGVSRQTVNVLRNKFLGHGILRVLRIPDVSKLGFGLLAFTHLHMNPHHSIESRRPHVESLLEDSAHVLKISSDLESVLLSVHGGYGGFRRSYDRLLAVYRDNGLLLGDPVVRVFPVEQTEHILEHNYANLVSGILM